MKTTTRNLAFRGDEEEEDDVGEEDRGALGPFWLLALLEVEEDDEEASQTTAVRARWFFSELSLLPHLGTKEETNEEDRGGSG